MANLASIEHSQVIAHPPARVWQALTDPALHAKWWAAGDVRPEVGHEFTLDMGEWGKQRCTVLAAEPERLFSYTFAPDTLNSVITWRLAPEGAGTRLSLEHSGLDLDTPMGKRAYEGMGRGWPHVVGRIEPALGS